MEKTKKTIIHSAEDKVLNIDQKDIEQYLSEVKKAVEKDGLVLAQGRIWTDEQYLRNKQYKAEYNRKKYKMYGIRFLNESEQDIIEYLNGQENLNQYFRELILADMKKKKK